MSQSPAMVISRLSSPNQNFYWASLTFACNWQQPFLNMLKEENDCKNYYFMINLHESMGPGLNSRSLVCIRIRHRLHYGAQFSELGKIETFPNTKSRINITPPPHTWSLSEAGNYIQMADSLILLQYFGKSTLSRKNMHSEMSYIVSVPPFST